MSVLLPAPFSPRTPWTVPAGTLKLMPSLARTGPKCLWMSTSFTSTYSRYPETVLLVLCRKNEGRENSGVLPSLLTCL